MAMVYEFIDSFDHYQWADINAKYTSSLGNGSIQSGTAKHGMAFSALSAATIMRDGLTPHPSYVIGLWFRTSSSGNIFIMKFRQGSSPQIQLEINNGGAGNIGASRVGTLIGKSANGVMTTNTWYWIEFKVSCDNAAGFVGIRVNGTTVYTNAAADTTTTAIQSIDGFELGEGQPSFYDSVVVMRGAATGVFDNTTYPGTSRIDAYYPNGNGGASQFTNSSGTSANNYAFIDEQVPDGDTTYVKSLASGTKDLYAISNLIDAYSNLSIPAVQLVVDAKKLVANSTAFIPIVKSGGVEYYGMTTGLLAVQNYTMPLNIWMYDPNTSGATGVWLSGTFNSAEFGYVSTVL